LQNVPVRIIYGQTIALRVASPLRDPVWHGKWKVIVIVGYALL